MHHRRRHMGYRISIMPESLAVCRLTPDAVLPPWAISGSFCSITRTAEELSVVVEQDRVPPGVNAEGPWCALKVQGPIPFSTVGVLASLADPLAAAGVSLFAISTFDTDYILVPQGQRAAARAALIEAGHTIVGSGEVAEGEEQTP